MNDPDSWLPPAHISVRCLEDETLELRVHADVFSNISVRRTFPVTDPDHYILLLDASDEEIGIKKNYTKTENNRKTEKYCR